MIHPVQIKSTHGKQLWICFFLKNNINIFFVFRRIDAINSLQESAFGIVLQAIVGRNNFPEPAFHHFVSEHELGNCPAGRFKLMFIISSKCLFKGFRNNIFTKVLFQSLPFVIKYKISVNVFPPGLGQAAIVTNKKQYGKEKIPSHQSKIQQRPLY